MNDQSLEDQDDKYSSEFEGANGEQESRGHRTPLNWKETQNGVEVQQIVEESPVKSLNSNSMGR